MVLVHFLCLLRSIWQFNRNMSCHSLYHGPSHRHRRQQQFQHQHNPYRRPDMRRNYVCATMGQSPCGRAPKGRIAFLHLELTHAQDLHGKRAVTMRQQQGLSHDLCCHSRGDHGRTGSGDCMDDCWRHGCHPIIWRQLKIAFQLANSGSKWLRASSGLRSFPVPTRVSPVPALTGNSAVTNSSFGRGAFYRHWQRPRLYQQHAEWQF